MRKSAKLALGWLASLAVCASVSAQETSTLEQGPDGVTYRVTRRTVQRSIPATEYQTREHKVYTPQTRTEYQTYSQDYLTPVTEYRWVPRMHGRWNPFVQPYWTHHAEPHTWYERRPASVQVPVTRTEWVEETRTAQVPVTTYRTVQEEYTSRVAVSASPTSTIASGGQPATIARSYGGQRMESDPPRGPSPLGVSAPDSSYRR